MSWAAQGTVFRGWTRSGRTRRSALPQRWLWAQLTEVFGWASSGRTNQKVRPHVRVFFALPPAPSRSHPGSVHRALVRGRGGTSAAGPRASHRSDSPTDARSVGSGSRRPREETGESGEEMCSYLEYGAVRRLSMRSAAAWGGDCGFPHGGAAPRGVVEPRRAAWGAVSLASRPREARFHQPADAGPFAWTRGGATASWDKFENLSGA